MSDPHEQQLPADEAKILADVAARTARKVAADQARRDAESARLKAGADSVVARMAQLGEKIRQNPIPTAAEDDKHLAKIKTLRAQAGIPPRHDHEIPATTHPWCATRDLIVKMLDNGFLIALSGIQGTGKTQMGVAIIHAATALNRPCQYALAMDFFIALKSTFVEGARQTEGQVIAAYVKPKLLVLDEMDERSASDWENRLLFHMINQRYNNLVDTLLISRETEEKFRASLHPSIQSRIQETGGSIVCDWPSFREERA